MGWIAIAFICVLVILIVIFNASRRKRSENDIRKPIEDNKSEPVMDTLPEPNNLTISRDAQNKYERHERQQVSREAVPYEHSGEGTRTYARYDWQKHFEESIMTPFPEEWSPALPYLYGHTNVRDDLIRRERCFFGSKLLRRAAIGLTLLQVLLVIAAAVRLPFEYLQGVSHFAQKAVIPGFSLLAVALVCYLLSYFLERLVFRP